MSIPSSPRLSLFPAALESKMHKFGIQGLNNFVMGASKNKLGGQAVEVAIYRRIIHMVTAVCLFQDSLAFIGEGRKGVKIPSLGKKITTLGFFMQIRKG